MLRADHMYHTNINEIIQETPADIRTLFPPYFKRCLPSAIRVLLSQKPAAIGALFQEMLVHLCVDLEFQIRDCSYSGRVPGDTAEAEMCYGLSSPQTYQIDSPNHYCDSYLKR